MIIRLVEEGINFDSWYFFKNQELFWFLWNYCFIEKDHNKDSHWFNLEEGQFIQGLVAHYNDEQQIYVVTVEPDPLTKHIHDRWPRIIYNTA